MASSKKTLRTCPKGHRYYKSSDCPTCLICEEERKPKDGFLAFVAAPARRALENNGITTLKQLSKFSEEEVLKFHGIGIASLPKLKEALSEKGLSFKTK
jgi:predicted RecB family nuclease